MYVTGAACKCNFQCSISFYSFENETIRLFFSTHLSIRFSFFLHGESQVCASIDVRQHMPLRRLQPYHLSVATQDHQQVPGKESIIEY